MPPKRTYKRPEDREAAMANVDHDTAVADLPIDGEVPEVSADAGEPPPAEVVQPLAPIAKPIDRSLFDPLEELKGRLAKAYPRAIPRQLAHGLLASLQRYPEQTLKLNNPVPLHVEANEHTVSWLMAVVLVLAPDEQE